MSQLTSIPGAHPSSLRRAIQAVLALACLVAGATSAVSACSSSSEDCVGGVLVDGQCEGKCKPDLCLADNTCVGNRCVLKCDSHSACYPGTQDCTAATEDDTGASIMVCASNQKPPGFSAQCPFGPECGQFGTCPDGSPCNPFDQLPCGDSTLECSVPFVCLGAGEGDADAYCTQHDCQSDADCPGGYQCGITRDPHAICNSMPAKGNSNLCGRTSEACIDKDTFGNGNTYSEGSLCILRNTCIKRTQCAPCQTDLDCSLVEGQRCVAVGSESRCARTCNVDVDCDPDYRCDTGACVPRFGSCAGTGNFCEPCQNDNDCGGPESTRACAELSGGQRACFDYAFPDTCTVDADCPASPSGKRGECLDEAEGVGPGDSVYHRCYLPYNPSDNKFGCW